MSDAPVPGPLHESTRTLIRRWRGGDAAARDTLIGRYMPHLRAWARGRLPARARHGTDTDDLVQNTLIRALDHLKDFDPRHEGAFFAYLRRILQNQIRDQLRYIERRPPQDPLPDDARVAAASPLEQAIGSELLASYEAALEQLTDEQRAAVSLRVELGLSYQEIADWMDKPSANAVRMLVTRGLVRLSEVMDGPGA